jgi:hypothetical protein
MDSSLFDKQFIFIIGAPRSGTTWLHAMIAEHLNVAATDQIELTFFDSYLDPILKRWNLELHNIENDKWVKGLPYLWDKEEFYEFIKGFFVKYYIKLIEKKPYVSHVLDKNPAYSKKVHLIHDFLPDAKFIHLIRDGRNVAASMISVSSRVGFGNWDISKAATDWCGYVEDAWEAANLGSEQYLELKYEDLMTNTYDQLNLVFKFCNLPSDKKTIYRIIDKTKFKISHYSSPSPYNREKDIIERDLWQEHLSPIQKYVFNKIAGDLLADLNYAEDKWWYKNTIQKEIILGAYYIDRLKILIRKLKAFEFTFH